MGLEQELDSDWQLGAANAAAYAYGNDLFARVEACAEHGPRIRAAAFAGEGATGNGHGHRHGWGLWFGHGRHRRRLR